MAHPHTKLGEEPPPGLSTIVLVMLNQDDFALYLGMTLVSLACSSPLEEGIVSQIDYLVNKQKADVTINDTDKNTPLHHLACNSIKKSNDVSN